MVPIFVTFERRDNSGTEIEVLTQKLSSLIWPPVQKWSQLRTR